MLICLIIGCLNKYMFYAEMIWYVKEVFVSSKANIRLSTNISFFLADAGPFYIRQTLTDISQNKHIL